jgi:hypothetical protein
MIGSALVKHKKLLRQILYLSVVLGLILRVVYELTKGQVSGPFILGWAVAVLLMIVTFEFALAWSERLEGAVTFAPSHNQLTERRPQIHGRLVTAKHVALVGGTFKTFADRAENLDALSKRASLGPESSTRILILNPKGKSLIDIARSRKELGRLLSLDDLEQEIRMSLARLSERLGDRMPAIVRLYEGPLSLGIYRFDDEFVLTLYTYGRGASSPSMFIRRSAEHSDFLDSVSRGVEELWNAPSSVPATRDALTALGVALPYSSQA